MTEIVPAGLLSVAFVAAAFMKATHVDQTGQAFRVRLRGPRFARPLVWCAVAVEALIAVLVLVDRTQGVGALLAIAFLAFGTAWLVGAKGGSTAPVLADCGCFGMKARWSLPPSVEPLKPVWWTCRNGVLIGLALRTVVPELDLLIAIGVGVAALGVVATAVLGFIVVSARARLARSLRWEIV
jgi:hypothetical protein